MGKIPGPIAMTVNSFDRLLREAKNGIFIECSTQEKGTVAFWGTQGKNNRNIKYLLEKTPPFKISAEFGWTPNPNYTDQHKLWIPEAAGIRLVE